MTKICICIPRPIFLQLTVAIAWVKAAQPENLSQKVLSQKVSQKTEIVPSFSRAHFLAKRHLSHTRVLMGYDDRQMSEKDFFHF